MKLVMFYTAGDGCTYSCDVHLPFEYESAEAAIVDFERLCKRAQNDKMNGRSWGMFRFCGTDFDCSTFHSYETDQFYLPTIYTLDEWFETHRIGK